jgi:hypothetical protein
MVGCMARKTMGISCSGSCGGAARDMIDCGDGFLEKCGYKKVPPDKSSLCNTTGAVRVYNTSPTSMGQLYGHTEFVSAPGEYCSIYAQPLDHPWPSGYSPSACWFPAKDGVLPDAPAGTAPSSLGTSAASQPAYSPMSSPAAPMSTAAPTNGAFSAGGGAGGGGGGMGGMLGGLMSLMNGQGDDQADSDTETYPLAGVLGMDSQLPGMAPTAPAIVYPLTNTTLPVKSLTSSMPTSLSRTLRAPAAAQGQIAPQSLSKQKGH